MASTPTRTITGIDPKTGEDHEFEVPTRKNGWIYAPDRRGVEGDIVWVDPYDDDHFISISKVGGHNWVAKVHGEEEETELTASTPEVVLGHAETLLMSRSTFGPNNGTMEVGSGETVTHALYDGSIRFLPPHTKKEADYLTPSDPQFDDSHSRCGSCVHFIEGGGCHFVQGDIDPAAYCGEFYADYGVFSHLHDDFVEVNAELVSPRWDYRERDIEEFLDDLGERLQQRRRELDADEGRGS